LNPTFRFSFTGGGAINCRMANHQLATDQSRKGTIKQKMQGFNPPLPL
jgi:hypothetical protein